MDLLERVKDQKHSSYPPHQNLAGGVKDFSEIGQAGGVTKKKLGSRISWGIEF